MRVTLSPATSHQHTIDCLRKHSIQTTIHYSPVHRSTFEKEL